jgi:hypothetical protein
MPRREVGEILTDLRCRIFKLGLYQALAVQHRALKLCHNVSTVAPGVKVTSILDYHFADEAQLLLPNATGQRYIQSFDCAIKGP